MKTKEIRKKSTEELNKMLRNLEMDYVKASSAWGREKVKDKEAGINIKGTTKKGEKTSLQKQIRRTIAQIKTIIRERELNKHGGQK